MSVYSHYLFKRFMMKNPDLEKDLKLNLSICQGFYFSVPCKCRIQVIKLMVWVGEFSCFWCTIQKLQPKSMQHVFDVFAEFGSCSQGLFGFLF